MPPATFRCHMPGKGCNFETSLYCHQQGEIVYHSIQLRIWQYAHNQSFAKGKKTKCNLKLRIWKLAQLPWSWEEWGVVLVQQGGSVKSDKNSIVTFKSTAVSDSNLQCMTLGFYKLCDANHGLLGGQSRLNWCWSMLLCLRFIYKVTECCWYL